jgi:hypothetical protein
MRKTLPGQQHPGDWVLRPMRTSHSVPVSQLNVIRFSAGQSPLPNNARNRRLPYLLICYLLPASPGQPFAINSYERIRWA